MLDRSKCHLLLVFVTFQICLYNIVKAQVDENSVSEKTQSANMLLVSPDTLATDKPDTLEKTSISEGVIADGSGSTNSGSKSKSEGDSPLEIKPNLAGNKFPEATVSGGSNSMSTGPVVFPTSAGLSTVLDKIAQNNRKSLDVSGGSTVGEKQEGKSKRCNCKNKKNKKI
ncbi:uncharacterized protein [Diabrotica undecimpunctata]|uniref:uncharacterized protein n=1 Tax=Diabrotica undecimpunctata TaxID=50387 RepID=UPI003B63E851